MLLGSNRMLVGVIRTYCGFCQSTGGLGSVQASLPRCISCARLGGEIDECVPGSKYLIFARQLDLQNSV